MNKTTLCATAALLFFMAGRAAADDDAGYFRQGTWTAQAYGSYTHNIAGERAQIGAGTIGAGYYLFDNFGLNAEFSGYYNDQQGRDAAITAGGLLFRHHLLHSGRFSLFLDGGAGISYANHRTPYYGTYYNYVLQTGVGTAFQLHDNLYLLGGVRYFHLSNAHLEGPAHNPGINGIQAYVGLMVRF